MAYNGSKPPIKPKRVYKLLRKAGVPDSPARQLVPISTRESGRDPDANNAGLNSNGTVDHGLFQINDIWRNDPDIKAIGWGKRYQAKANAKMAAVVLDKQGLTAWATYDGSNPDPWMGKLRKDWSAKGNKTIKPKTYKLRQPSTPPRTQVDVKGALVDALLSKDKGSPLLQRAAAAVATGAYTTTTPGKEGKVTKKTLPGVKADRSKPSKTPKGSNIPSKNDPHDLLELFWQGEDGINVKNGQVVAQGFVDGHTEHVHVAGGPKAVDKLGRLAQAMGLHVGENETFDPVDPVHTTNSYHYSNRAIDVSGDPALMRRFAHRVARIYGVE